MPDCCKCGTEQDIIKSYTVSKPFPSDMQPNPKRTNLIKDSSCLCDKCFQENKKNILFLGVK